MKELEKKIKQNPEETEVDKVDKGAVQELSLGFLACSFVLKLNWLY